jgi:alpha-beta hydrolase superfamily lysophospholipase
MKKNILLIILGTVLVLSVVIFVATIQDRQPEIVSPLVPFFQKPLARPLEKYSFENLRQREYQRVHPKRVHREGSEIKLEKVIKEEERYTSWLFSFQSDGKRVTGMANLPKKQGRLPVVVMLRGYADEEIYFTGLGTRKAAGVFAENGFITLAPDFLGFGGSDTSSADILEARFERPVTVLNLISSINSINSVSPNQLFLWGHSNGGQIALSVLEILRKPIPTVLWAPVTKGFPESVLQYMGEMDDQGLKVKKAIDEFLKIYDPKKYSIDNYFQDIPAPLQVHQGTADEYIESEWTDEFVKKMKELNKSVIYYKYPHNDHNLKRDWDLVIQRDLEFFRKNLPDRQ